MPLYTYHCPDCGVTFEEKQTFLEKPLPVCPHCLHRAVRRIPQRPAIIFKGPGWYSTTDRPPTHLAPSPPPAPPPRALGAAPGRTPAQLPRGHLPCRGSC